MLRFYAVIALLCCAVKAVKFVENCPGRPADIVFILDESNSIWIKHFEKQLMFVRNVAREFTISPEKVRIGMITWNTKARMRWGLTTYKKKEEVLSEIANVDRKLGGRTYTHMALAMAREMFREQKRSGVPHIAILMTDGASSMAELTKLEAARIHKDNITVFAIGIGNVNMDELKEIATDEHHAYRAKAFAELGEKLKNQLVASTCEIKEVKQPGECGPNDKVDLAFVLGSVNQNPPGAMKAMGLFKNIINDRGVIVGQNNVQVAMVPSDCVPMGFNLNTYNDKESLLFHFQYAGARFDTTADLINVMRDQTFIKENGARKEARQVAVVVLDEKSPNMEETVRAAQAATEKGIKVVCIGVGDRVNSEEIAKVASNPDLSFRVKDYDELWTLREDIIWNQVCP